MPWSLIDNLTLPCAPLNYVLLSCSYFAVSQLISSDSRDKDNFGPEGSTSASPYSMSMAQAVLIKL